MSTFNEHESPENCQASSIPQELELPKEAVLVKSAPLPSNTPTIQGYDFNRGIDYDSLLRSYINSGFQASNFGLAVQQINLMISARNDPVSVSELVFDYPEQRPKTGCTIFLGFTSNMISSGLRETIRFLVEHNLVDCLVTSAGGVEEDLIKCLAPTYLGAFALDGAELRRKGLNRIGNLLVPNDNYCLFEDWLMPILDECLLEQNGPSNFNWTPSKLIRRLGQQVDDKNSVCYWAYRNNIPVFCPALTDGSLGDMLYFHSYKNPGLRLDIIELPMTIGGLCYNNDIRCQFGVHYSVFQDVRHINNMAVKSIKSGMVILGGGLVKHHINNANLMRNGADFAVYINTGQEFDGSDSGARPDEAVSWGKIKSTAKPVKIYADASLVFPLIVTQTFAAQKYND